MHDSFSLLGIARNEQALSKAAHLLEEKEIPIIVEHSQIIEGNLRLLAYRILVPDLYLQRALDLVRFL